MNQDLFGRWFSLENWLLVLIIQNCLLFDGIQVQSLYQISPISWLSVLYWRRRCFNQFFPCRRDHKYTHTHTSREWEWERERERQKKKRGRGRGSRGVGGNEISFPFVLNVDKLPKIGPSSLLKDHSECDYFNAFRPENNKVRVVHVCVFLPSSNLLLAELWPG